MFFVSVPPSIFPLSRHHRLRLKHAEGMSLRYGVICARAGQGAGGEVYLTMNFLAVPLAKRAT